MTDFSKLLSRRARDIEEPAIIRMAQKARDMREAGHDVADRSDIGVRRLERERHAGRLLVLVDVDQQVSPGGALFGQQHLDQAGLGVDVADVADLVRGFQEIDVDVTRA